MTSSTLNQHRQLTTVAELSTVTYGRCTRGGVTKHVGAGLVLDHNEWSSGRPRRCSGSGLPAAQPEEIRRG